MRITNTSNLLGYEGESYSRALTFEIEDSLKDCDLYFEFEKPNKDKYVSEKIDITTSYLIPFSLLDEVGFLKIQIVAYRGNNFIQKSGIRDFYISKSINAIDVLLADEGVINVVRKVDKLYETIKFLGDGNKYLSDNGEYKEVSSGTNDYNKLENKPLEKIVKLDYEDPIILRDLESNVYVMQGYAIPFKDSSDLFIIQAPLQVGITRFEDVSYVQLFFPVNNLLQFFEIKNDNYTMKQSSFNDLEEKINVAKFQNVIECALKYRIGKSCSTINEVLDELNNVYSLAKIVVNATDSVTGEVLTNVSVTITSQTKWEDGCYYLEPSENEYSMIIICSGYTTQRVSFLVTNEDVEIGEKIIEVKMVEVEA